ncbi:hypothetical protein RJT34_00166 [Clitoria ternatea]|uniref:Cation/H+ exchanger domain-containing protein n=1 Tax=Clitoria ternatea TaxID=43366 RepID=A0AAN9KHZ7_CLITE
MDTVYKNGTLFFSVNEMHINDFHTYNVCIDLPPPMRSDSIFATHNYGVSSLLHRPLTILELQIVTIFMITQCFHFFLKRLSLPYFFSSAMAGFVLGPTIKIVALDMYKKTLFPFGSEDTLSLISIFGYTFHLFVNCVQMDFSMITRTGKRAWTIALSTVLVPISVGFIFTFHLLPSLLNRTIGSSQMIGLPVVFLATSGCSFQVVAALLIELKILNSELGRLGLATALVSDITSNLVNAIGTTVNSVSEVGEARAYANLVILICFVILIPMVTRPAMKWVVKITPEGRPVKKIYVYGIVATVLFLGVAMHNIHQPVFASAIVLGLSVPEGPPLGTALVDSLDMFATWFLFPIFLTSCIMKVDLTKCFESPTLVLVFVIFILGVHLIKILLSIGICRFCKMPITDGVCIGLILTCKGAIDICSYTLIYDSKKFNDQQIGLMVILALVVGSIVRIGVTYLYDPSRKYAGYQKRNLISLKSNNELRIVACIHKPCHIIPTRNILDFCFPTTNKKLMVDALHLVELVGRSSPILISHRLKKMVSSSLHNLSGELIVTFNLFEHDYAGVATVNTYTAISPITLMHEDICYVAMDRIASLIILPFHVKWGQDGSIEYKDSNIRSVNTKVMEKAPCSIGILVNRGSYSKLNSSSNCLVAMIFIGGVDDREALCFAKRSIRESHSKLVVYRLILKGSDVKSWDIMLDDEVLREVQGYGEFDNVIYEEVVIEDASETTVFLNNVANKFDFIIVGRRNGITSAQTSGLEHWTEYLELGVVGDLLASPDLETRASILVVQQQQLHTSDQ